MAKETNYKDYYAQMLKEGEEYQDKVAAVLMQKLCMVVTFNKSKKYQYSDGESKQGVEIKYDKNFRKTNNLYIEFAEKSHPSNPNYVKSGILREDNTWLWAIGDYETIYCIPKRYLIKGYMSGRYRTVQTATSKGYLLPIDDCLSNYSAVELHVKDMNQERIQF